MFPGKSRLKSATHAAAYALLHSPDTPEDLIHDGAVSPCCTAESIKTFKKRKERGV